MVCELTSFCGTLEGEVCGPSCYERESPTLNTQLGLRPIHQVVRDNIDALNDRGKAHSKGLMDMYASMANIRINPLEAGRLFVRSSVIRLPNVRIALTECSPCKAVRDMTHVSNAGDDVVVCFVLSGTVGMVFNGSDEVVCPAGGVFLDPNDRSSGRIFSQASSFVDIALPRSVVAPLVDNADHLMRSARRPVDISAQRLLVSYVRTLMSEEIPLSPATYDLASTHIQDLLIAALGAKSDARELAEQRGIRTARLSAVKADIVANLTDPKLSLHDIAHRHGISPQYIRELFRREGTTVTDFVRTERLKRARRMLTDRRYARCSISTIAYACGFNDLSYFNRMFRRYFDMTPSDARMLGGEGESR